MVRGSLDKKWVCHTKPSISPRGRISEAKKSANFPKFSFSLRPLQAIFVKIGKMGPFQFWKGHCHYFCSWITHIMCISPRGRISEAKKSSSFPKFSFFLRPLQAILVKIGKMGLFQFWKGHCHYFCSWITHIMYWVQKIDIFRQKNTFLQFSSFQKILWDKLPIFKIQNILFLAVLQC